MSAQHTPGERWFQVSQQELAQLMTLATAAQPLQGVFGPNGFFIRAELSSWAVQHVEQARAAIAKAGGAS